MLKNEYEEILSLLNDERIKYGVELPKDLHKKLVLGQTRYVCRYGTLGDGHEHITPAKRYFQSLREIYYLAKGIKEYRCVAMDARADELEAAELPEETEVQKLRKEAALLRARSRLTDALVGVQDQMRMLDEYDKVRRELEPQVEAQYPEGVEQAELDNWIALYKYRIQKGRTPGLATPQVDNIPLPLDIKAELGYLSGRFDAIAPLAVTDPELCQRLENKILNTQTPKLTEVK